MANGFYPDLWTKVIGIYQVQNLNKKKVSPICLTFLWQNGENGYEWEKMRVSP